MQKLISVSSLAVVLALFTHPLNARQTDLAQSESATPVANMAQQGESPDGIYGVGFMTSQERLEYQAQMRQLASDGERAEFRARHHEQMNERALAQGKTLPDQVPDNLGRQGGGMGQGMGRGPGMQQGMQPGMGQGPGMQQGVPPTGTGKRPGVPKSTR